MALGERSEILIVGAGPAGLITTHELARRGVPVRLIERRGRPAHTTRAFTLHARTMEMFEHIGVAHRLEEICLVCPGNVYHFQGMTDKEKPRTDFRTLPTRYAFYYKINQNDFEQVLREHLLAHYGIIPEYGSELVGLECSDDRVRVQIRHSDTGELEEAGYPWLVGCDGAHSQVRKAAGIAFPGQRVGVMAMMDVELEGFAYDDSWVNYFIGKDLFMLVTKLPGLYWRVYLSDVGAMTQADQPQASFQAVADQLGIGMTIKETHWSSKWEIFNSIAETYRSGRVLLCGDASHQHSPAGGQGMNGCMQDAFNLGWKLAAVYRGQADEQILDTYEAERKPIGEQITAGAKSTHDIVMAFGKGIEDRIAITRQPEWQDNAVRLIAGLAHNYRGTVSVPSGLTPVPGPQAGDRAPDAQLASEPRRRLYDLLRHCGFTALFIPGHNADTDIATAHRVAERLHAAHGPLVRSILVADRQAPAFDVDHWAPDQNGELARAYELSGIDGRAVLVRPDIYVGMNCRLDEADRLIEYVCQWFAPKRDLASTGN